MASLSACPGCGRRAKKAISSSFFPVRTCKKCRHKYCNDCGGRTCPKCGDSGYAETDKVHA